ncbi:MAG: M23 family metallopeptidase [Bacillota bacterium]|nr:M23 family metallopeptidase [Bacillota bacterium]
MPSNRQTKTQYEPLYIATRKSLARGRARLARSFRDFWHDLTVARGARYYRALAAFCVVCMLVGMGASVLWRSTAVRAAMDRYRAVFLGQGETPTGESPPIQPPGGTSSATPPVSAGTAETPAGSGAAGGEGTTPASGATPAGGSTAAAQSPRPDLTTMLRPVTGPVLLGYGWQFNATLNDWRYHGGVDLQVAEGTAVRAALAGTVAAVGDSFDLGLSVVIDHGGGVRTVYGSLKSVAVNAGQNVTRAQEIGKAGSTAEAESALGPHVHFELLDGGEPIDPTMYLK